MKWVLGAAFVLAIVGANWLTSNFGMVPVGFGLVATAGTYLAGATFLIRDGLQETGGKWLVAGFIVVGAALSYLLSVPQIAVASGVAFLLSEALDLAVYTPLRERSRNWAVVASNVVGSFFDTVIFLAIAGFPLWSSVPGQMLGKLTITAAFIGLAAASALLRKPVR